MSVRFLLCGMIAAATLTVPIKSQAAQPTAQDHAKQIAPYLDDQTVAVATVDLTKVDITVLKGMFLHFIRIKTSGLMPSSVAKSVDEMENVIGGWLKQVQDAGAIRLTWVVTMGDFPREMPFLIVSTKPGADQQALSKWFSVKRNGLELPFSLYAMGYRVSKPIGNALFVGTEFTKERLKTLTPDPRPDLAAALAADPNAAVQIIVIPSKDQRRVARELAPPLPEEFGKLTTADFVDGARWMSTALALKPSPRVTLRVQAPGEKQVQQTASLVNGTRNWFANHPEVKKAFPRLRSFLLQLNPTVQNDQVVIDLNQENKGVQNFLTAMASPIDVMTNSAQVRRQINSLKWIGLALHNYHDNYKAFPAAASTATDGKPLLSWRVHILPFIEQAELYKQFRLDEPWDSEHNKKLIAKMPDVYAGADQKNTAAGKTTFLAPVGEHAIFAATKPRSIRTILDGTSNTILVLSVDSKDAVTWTKPADFNADQPNVLTVLRGPKERLLLFLLADGSVHNLESKELTEHLLKALLTRAGKEIVKLP